MKTITYPIVLEVAPTFDKLIAAIAKFSSESFNQIPFEGSWTAGQVAEHLRLSAANITDLLYGNVSETIRPPDALIPQIKDLFLNFETKLQSPDFIIPEAKSYDIRAMISVFNTVRAGLEKAVAELDLSPTCDDFALPNWGKLTRLEWIVFVTYHFQRHTMQIENIFKKV